MPEGVDEGTGAAAAPLRGAPSPLHWGAGGAAALVALARATAEAAVRGEAFSVPPVDGAGEAWGLFVSIKLFGEYRGVAGGYAGGPVDVGAEVARRAAEAARDDPRFVPLSSAELPLVSYAVDLLGPAEPAAGAADLDPQRYAVLIESGERQALLPPFVEGVATGSQQLALALASAGVSADEPYRLLRLPAVHVAEADFDRRRPVVDDDDE